MELISNEDIRNDNRAQQQIEPLQVVIGKIEQIDNLNRTAKVSYSGGSTPIPAVIGGVSNYRGSIEVSEGYAVGDWVLVAVRKDLKILSSGAELQAVIICKAAAVSLTFDDDNSSGANGGFDPTSIYEKQSNSVQGKLTEQTYRLTDGDRGTAAFPVRGDEDTYTAGSYSLAGERAKFTVTDLSISAKTDNSAISVDCLGFVRKDGIWEQSNFLTHNSGDYVVGEHSLSRQRESLGLTSNAAVIRSVGDAVGGLSYSVVDGNNRVLSRTTKDAAGSIIFQTANGIVMERAAVSTISPKDDRPIKVGDQTSKALNSRVPGGDIIEDCYGSGDDFDITPKIGEMSGTLSPLDAPSNNLDKTIKITDPITGNDIQVAGAKSRWGLMPDGSFVVSDAWGSEIRMFGGDIFISPARNLVTTTPGDSVSITGGVISLSGDGGVNVGSSEGRVDVFGKSGAIIASSEDVAVSANKYLTLVGSEKISMSSLSDIELSGKRSVVSRSEGDVILQGTSATVLGKNRCAVSTTNGVIKIVGNGLTVGGSVLSVMSDLVVSGDAAASGFDVLGVSVKPSKGSGSISCGGYIMAEKGISSNGWFKSVGILSASSVVVSTVNKEAIGVFKGKKSSKDTLAKASDVRFSVGNDDLKGELDDTNRTFKNSLKGLFSAVIGKVYVILPGIRKLAKKIAPLSVEAAESEVYIYPGKEFWTKTGLYTIKDKDYYSMDGVRVSEPSGAKDISK